jgi:hypothetical protein
VSQEKLESLQVLFEEKSPYSSVPYTKLDWNKRAQVRKWYDERMGKLKVTSKKQVSQGQYFDNTPKTIKNFSGSTTPGPGELTHRRWKRAVMAIIEDQTIREDVRRRIVMRSIIGKAEDLIQPYRQGSLQEIITMIDCTYGAVHTVEAMKSDFYRHQQDEAEDAIEYFVDLYIEAGEIATEGGFSSERVLEEVVTQFCRGSPSEMLITKLGWEGKVESGGPLSFKDLSTQLRRECHRMKERGARSKPKISSTTPTPVKPTSYNKKKASYSAIVTQGGNPVEEDSTSDIDAFQLFQRLDHLEEKVNNSQSMPHVQPCSNYVMPVSTVQCVHRLVEEPQPDEECGCCQQKAGQVDRKQEPPDRKSERRYVQTRTKPFCYRCGQEDHICHQCNNDKNPKLVDQRYAERRAARTAKFAPQVVQSNCSGLILRGQALNPV